MMEQKFICSLHEHELFLEERGSFFDFVKNRVACDNCDTNISGLHLRSADETSNYDLCLECFKEDTGIDIANLKKIADEKVEAAKEAKAAEVKAAKEAAAAVALAASNEALKNAADKAKTAQAAEAKDAEANAASKETERLHLLKITFASKSAFVKIHRGSTVDQLEKTIRAIFKITAPFALQDASQVYHTLSVSMPVKDEYLLVV